LKIIISEKGKLEIEKLKFNVEKSIHNILRHIPKADLHGISHIVVTDLPANKQYLRNKVMAAYFDKHNNQSAFIEIYFKNHFGHVRSAASFAQMLPIQEIGLAKTIYHEVGHHIRITRTHGINQRKDENFAERYAEEIMANYVIDNAEDINSCFDYLDSIATDQSLSIDILNNMRAGWQRTYKRAMARSNKTPQ
jgi:hypothetical protein